MKILQINKYHYLRGGSERVFFNTVDLLERHGHDVAVFATRHPQNTPSPYDNYFAHAPEIRDLGTLGKIQAIPRFFRNRDAERSLDRLLADFKPDVAHLHNIFNGLGLGILPVLKRHGVKVVITLHDLRMLCPSAKFNMPGMPCDACSRSLFSRCLANKCCEGSLLLSAMGMAEMIHKEHLMHYDRYIDSYIFLNNTFRDLAATRHGYFADKGEVLFNFNPHLDPEEPKRGEYVLFYGRMSPEKGTRTLLEAARRLPDVKFKFVGIGEELETARRLALPNVEIAGFLSGDDLERAIKDASFVTVPSECMENNPMTVVEGFSHSKPVVASRIGGIPDIVADGLTGFLAEPFDADSLTDALRRAAGLSDNRYLEMASNARKFAADNFAPEAHYNRLLQIYSK